MTAAGFETFLGRRGRAALGFALVIAIALAFLVARDAPPFATLEDQTLDWRFAARGAIAPGGEVVVLAIDDRTLDALGPWPIPRQRLAEAVLAVARDGARVVAIDLLFSGDTRPDGASADGPTLPEALSIVGKSAVAFAFATGDRIQAAPTLPDALAASAYRIAHAPVSGAPPPIMPTGVVAPGGEILAAAAAGHVNIVLDADGQLRHALPVIGYAGAWYPSLPIVAARLWRNVGPADLGVRFGEGIEIGDELIATDGRMRHLVNYYGPAGSFAQYSLVDVIEGRVPAGAFRDRLVLVGAAATGIGDVFATPFTPVLPGVEYFATVIDNILHERFLVRNERTAALDLVVLIVVGGLAALIGALARPVASIALLGVLVASVAVAHHLAFAAAGLSLNAVFPILTVIVLLLWNAAARTVHEGRLRQAAEARGTRLARYASPLAQRASAGPDAEPREAAVLFVDIRGFTGLAEAMAPGEAMRLLQRFHHEVEATVLRNRGVVDKFIGDGAMAVFGLEARGPAAARDALVCATELACGFRGLLGEDAANGSQRIDIGIGVHFGPVEFGEIGGAQHAEVTIGGDTVNVASRLEALTREHDVSIIASGALVDAVRATGDDAVLAGFVALPELEIRGRRRPVRAWAWTAAPRL
jgi:adenylate cyclase